MYLVLHGVRCGWRIHRNTRVPDRDKNMPIAAIICYDPHAFVVFRRVGRTFSRICLLQSQSQSFGVSIVPGSWPAENVGNARKLFGSPLNYTRFTLGALHGNCIGYSRSFQTVDL